MKIKYFSTAMASFGAVPALCCIMLILLQPVLSRPSFIRTGPSLRLISWPWHSPSQTHVRLSPSSSWNVFSVPVVTRWRSNPTWEMLPPINQRPSESAFPVVISLAGPTTRTAPYRAVSYERPSVVLPVSTPSPSPSSLGSAGFPGATPSWVRMVTGGTPLYDLVESAHSGAQPALVINRPAVTRIPQKASTMWHGTSFSTGSSPLGSVGPMHPLGLEAVPPQPARESEESATGDAASADSAVTGSPEWNIKEGPVTAAGGTPVRDVTIVTITDAPSTLEPLTEPSTADQDGTTVTFSTIPVTYVPSVTILPDGTTTNREPAADFPSTVTSAVTDPPHLAVTTDELIVTTDGPAVTTATNASEVPLSSTDQPFWTTAYLDVATDSVSTVQSVTGGVTSLPDVTTVPVASDIPVAVTDVVTTLQPVSDHTVVTTTSDTPATVTSESTVTTPSPSEITVSAVALNEAQTTEDVLDTIEIEINKRRQPESPYGTTVLPDVTFSTTVGQTTEAFSPLAVEAVGTTITDTPAAWPEAFTEQWPSPTTVAEVFTTDISSTTEPYSDSSQTTTESTSAETFPTTTLMSKLVLEEVSPTAFSPTEAVSTLEAETLTTFPAEDNPTVTTEASPTGSPADALFTSSTVTDETYLTTLPEDYSTYTVDSYTGEASTITAAPTDTVFTFEAESIPPVEVAHTTSDSGALFSTFDSPEASTTTVEAYSTTTSEASATASPDVVANPTSYPPQTLIVVTDPQPDLGLPASSTTTTAAPTSGPVRDFSYYDGVAFEDGDDLGGSPADGYIPDYDGRFDEYDGDYIADSALRVRPPPSPPSSSDTKGLEIASLVRETPASVPSPPRRSDVLPEDDDAADTDDIDSNDMSAGYSYLPSSTVAPPSTARDTFEGQMLRRMVPLVVRQFRTGHLSDEDMTRLRYIFGPIWPEVEGLARAAAAGRGRRDAARRVHAAISKRRSRREAAKYPHFKRWRGDGQSAKPSGDRPARRPTRPGRRRRLHKHKQPGRGRHPREKRPKHDNRHAKNRSLINSETAPRPKRASATTAVLSEVQDDDYNYEENDKDYMNDDSDYYEAEDEDEYEEEEEEDEGGEPAEEEEVGDSVPSRDLVDPRDNPSVMELLYRSRQAPSYSSGRTVQLAPSSAMTSARDDDDEAMAMDGADYEYY